MHVCACVSVCMCAVLFCVFVLCVCRANMCWNSHTITSLSALREDACMCMQQADEGGREGSTLDD